MRQIPTTPDKSASLPELAITPAEALEIARKIYDLDVVSVALRSRDPDGGGSYTITRKIGGWAFLFRFARKFERPGLPLQVYLRDRCLRNVHGPVRNLSYKWLMEVNGFQVMLETDQPMRPASISNQDTESDWIRLGEQIRLLHNDNMPESESELAATIPSETFTLSFAGQLQELLQIAADTDRAEKDSTLDQAILAFLRENRSVLRHLAAHTEILADRLRAARPFFVLCHNHLDFETMQFTAAGAMYITGWQHAIFAPRERDLFALGAGNPALWDTEDTEDSSWSFLHADPAGPVIPVPQQKAMWFFQGYMSGNNMEDNGRPATQNDDAIAYYACHWILTRTVDFAVSTLHRDFNEDTEGSGKTLFHLSRMLHHIAHLYADGPPHSGQA